MNNALTVLLALLVSLPAVAGGYGCTTVAAVDGRPAATLTIRPNQRNVSQEMKESNSSFVCPPNTVLTGRWHNGDENGPTKYEYADLVASANDQVVAGTITVAEAVWGDWIKESSGAWYYAPAGRVLIGREHKGDENGNTRYLTGVVKFNGKAAQPVSQEASGAIKESSGNWFNTGPSQVMTGRQHAGDENGNTHYQSAQLILSEEPGQLHFKVIVKFHPGEEHFSMNPLDFIKLSRFRHHIGGGHDYGYNKVRGEWVKGDDHTAEYYDVSVAFINNYGLNPDGRNRRPRDENQGSKWNVFLEPDDNLRGESLPTGKVPAFGYSTGDSRKQYWLFFGYNKSEFGPVRNSHQGDWESLTLNNDGRNITGAWLSAHGKDKYYAASELELVANESSQTLIVYCARGSHALYPSVGSFHILGTDKTANGGSAWTITDLVLNLVDQPWKDYAGAWGEVGRRATTTGPLGPWYKKIK